MIIGITGNNENGKAKLSKYFTSNCSFKYFDIDSLIMNILKKSYYREELKKDTWKKIQSFC